LTGARKGGAVSTRDERSVQNPREGASSVEGRDGRLYFLFLVMVIAVYAAIGYGIYKVIEALA
jgi:hypothetical protein